MQLSDILLNRKVWLRITLLLVVSAIIPAICLTLLSNQVLSEFIAQYKHQPLIAIISSKGYIGLALLSLLSLTFSRKTMIPLQQLIKGTEDVAKGDFTPIPLNTHSALTELTVAFNQMSASVKRQFDTLRFFSKIDQEMVTKVDIGQVIQHVINRIQSIEPDAIVLIAKLEEQSSNEVECSCSVTGHEALTTIRLSLLPNEVEEISRHQQGLVKRSRITSDLTHERLMAELNANYMWIYPIFWQGKICAFLSIGSKKTLSKDNPNWSEFRGLASRIGTAISTNEREQKLLIEAQYDSLTGLPNRTLLQDRLKLAMEHSNRTGKAMWVVFIDLDRFKVVNDSMGHAIGDQLLKELGKRLIEETRDTDTVARFGGDEFVIVLSGDAGENIQLSVLSRIMNTVAKPVTLNNHELINSCSIGISIYPDDGNHAESLIKDADIAMYRAKELGRNNYQFFTQDLNAKAAKRMQMISLLRKAISNEELTLHYQPKVNLQSNLVAGFEALLRWKNPILGNVLPEKFIPIAEEAGLIIEIGEWVLKTACKQMVTWHRAGVPDLVLSVNVSSRQFQEESFVDQIKTTLLKTGLQANRLELELTEYTLMDRSTNKTNTINTIKSLGIQLSIDDFGTGYSNLSYLHTLPVDTLKIDKAFIDVITPSKQKSPIVDTIIHFAKNLNLTVVAEGVETIEQVHYLEKQNCDQIQGYIFSKPLSAETATALLVSGKNLAPKH